mmetsp:Transcript_25755/g.60770  ORF Transcript_25755/g.60770 Transcript_25755/m.60770 type:complete len:576 (+) Transcript_25755:63-1790(+)
MAATSAAVTQLASRAELDALRTVDDARTWIGLSQDAWNALDVTLGKVPNLRVLALLPPGILQQSIESTMVQQADGTGRPRGLNMIEAYQARIMRSLARQKFHLPDEDPLEEILPAQDESPRRAAAEAAATAPPPPVAEEALEQPGKQGPGRATAPSPSQGVSPPSSAAVAAAPRPESSEPYPQVRAQPPKEEPEPRINPPVQHVQMIKTENFYHIHRTRGLHLGPRFRGVSMAAGTPGSTLAALRPRRPTRRLPEHKQASGGSKEGRWWRQYMPGMAPPPAPPPEQETSRPMNTARRSKKNLWPGGKIPKDGLGDGLLRDLHEPLWGIGERRERGPQSQMLGLLVSQDLLSGGGLVLPGRSANIPGMAHPAVLEDEEDDDCDEPLTYLPGLYDAILTCTFLAANPAPGLSTAQVPLPYMIRDFRVLPYASSSNSYFGHGHPTDQTGSEFYFEIRAEQGQPVANMDGFIARAGSRRAADSESTPQTTGATSSGGYIYRSQSRPRSPAPARPGSIGSTTAGSASVRSSSRGSAGRSSTPGARRARRAAAQESGSASLTQAEREEVRERVAKWSRHVP